MVKVEVERMPKYIELEVDYRTVRYPFPLGLEVYKGLAREGIIPDKITDCYKPKGQGGSLTFLIRQEDSVKKSDIARIVEASIESVIGVGEVEGYDHVEGNVLEFEEADYGMVVKTEFELKRK